MDKQQLRLLLDKYSKQNITPEEFAALDNWYHQINNAEVNFDSWVAGVGGNEMMSDQLYSDFTGRLKKQKKIASLWTRITAAASIILCLAAGGYFLIPKDSVQRIAQVQKHDFAPGGNKAFLILANGVKINLTNAHNGNIATQGNAHILKTTAGELAYSVTGAANPETLYNTIITPRGGQYNLTLSDGTKVWLNSASSIVYPATFGNKNREVTITGEAYFEVSKNKHLPFLVHSGSQTVEVLGTHFNINAYGDEDDIKTTLLEGSVKVSSPGATRIIVPGEQARFKNGLFKISNTDTEAAIAWKNGFFEYNGADIKTVMRAFARWYNVDIEYQGKIPERTFNVDIHRNVNASQALKILEYLKINYRMENQKIIISQ